MRDTWHMNKSKGLGWQLKKLNKCQKMLTKSNKC